MVQARLVRELTMHPQVIHQHRHNGFVPKIHLVNVPHRRARLEMPLDLRLHERVVAPDLLVPAVAVEAARIKLVDDLDRVSAALQTRQDVLALVIADLIVRALAELLEVDGRVTKRARDAAGDRDRQLDAWVQSGGHGSRQSWHRQQTV